MSRSNPDRAGVCPPLEILARVAKGVGSSDEESVVGAHLDGCAACRQRFDEALGPTEEFVALSAFAEKGVDEDLEAIKARGVPRFPQVEVRDGLVVIAEGLRLALPRDSRYIARLGAYDVISIVGRGAMGIVLKAFHEELQRNVALKLIGPSLLHDETAGKRFLREARSAAKLNHPHVVRIHAFGTHQEIPFIEMEYVDGTSLASVIAEEGCLEPDRAAKIARQVLSALEHAHQQQIIHRDVKPSNVLLEKGTELAKLVDFGLARGIADAVRHTAAGHVPGTPWYMSPEQASGTHQLDGRSDLFSLGVMLFEMLLGALPFPGQDPYRVVRSICEEEPPDPCRLNPAIPAALAEIVGRALKKDPTQRYQTAAEFIKAVDGYLNDLPLRPPASNRCSACSQIIVSRYSVVGACEVCQAPLCSGCWHARGVRRCARHGESGKVSDKPAAHKGSAAKPSIDRPVAQRPNRPAPEETPAGPAPPASEQLREKIARARAEGRPAVSAGEARVGEESFLRLVDNSLRSIREVTDPCCGLSFEVKSWSKAAQRIKKQPRAGQDAASAGQVPQTWGPCPEGAGVIYDLRKGGLGVRRGRVVIEAQNLVRLERFAAEGYDDRPVSRMELESLLNEVARRASREETWHLIILASPTGWTAEACDFATGKGPRPFRDRLVSVVLFREDAAGFLCGETDEKLVPFREAFSMDVDAATLRQARRFLDEHFQLNDSISLDTLVAELGISRKAAVQVCNILAATGQYALEVLDDLGMVLSGKR